MIYISMGLNPIYRFNTMALEQTGVKFHKRPLDDGAIITLAIVQGEKQSSFTEFPDTT